MKFRELGARLRMQRLAQSLSQRELAHMAGISLGAAQTGNRRPMLAGTLIRAVQALGLSTELTSCLC